MASTGALAIGIDLGTTNSCVAIFRNGHVEVIQNEENSNVIPSWVSFTDNGIITGHEAKAEIYKNEKNTIYEVKRLIGQRYNNEKVQTDIRRLSYKVVDDNGLPKIKVVYRNEEKAYSPQEISAFILKHLKRLAEAHLDQKVTNAVVTVPAYFNDYQRQATKDAATIAGFKKVDVINEPTAAALAFSYHNKKHYKRNVLVYDFGGGTFDVSIVNTGRSQCKVKATKGDSHLGGTDINANLVEFIKSDFKKRYSKELDDNSTMRRIKYRCDQIKEQLSRKMVTDLELCNLSGEDYSVSIRRSQFEELNISLFEKTIKIVDECIKTSGLNKSEIDEIVLVGGSSRIPKVHEMLTQYFGEDKINKGINPDEAVAYGAAIHALNLIGNKYEIEDVLSISVGLAVVSNNSKGLFNSDKLIPSNTSIPAKILRRYQTVQNNQDGFSISVHQGEAELADDNFELGSFILSGLAKGPAGSIKCDICFEIDFEGILKVTATEVGTSNESCIEIDAKKKGLTVEQIANRTLEMEKHIEEERRRKEFVLEKYKLKQMCDMAIEKSGSIAETAIRNSILVKCKNISKWLENLTFDSQPNLEENRMILEDMLSMAITDI